MQIYIKNVNIKSLNYDLEKANKRLHIVDGLIKAESIIDEIVTPASVTSLVKRLNTQRNVSVDYAMIEDADHMYNNHLTDLYKVVGHYIIDAMKKRTPTKKRRGRRKKSEMMEEQDETLLLENDSEDSMDDDFGDDEE